MTNESKDTPPPPPAKADEAREALRAKALRENLRRRKAAARSGVGDEHGERR